MVSLRDQTILALRQQVAELVAERDTFRALLARALVLLPAHYLDEQNLRAEIEAALYPKE